jgi:hypothetical protein
MNWFQIAQSEIETFFDIEQRIPEAEGQQRTIAAIDAFHELFMALTTELHIREEWPGAHCHIFPVSTGIIEHSSKLHVDFTLGVSLSGWFIEAPIASPEQIRHMRDDYWQHIVRLSALGKAELHDYGRPCGWSTSADVRRLTQHKGSLVYSIARDFTLLASTLEGCSSLGGIHLTLPLDSDEQAVRTFFKQSLESLYRSNHMLYRAEYLQRRRVLKKFKTEISNEPVES